jgi:hypothetical protein
VEGLDKLSRTIIAKVEEEHGISRLYGSRGANDARPEELIRNPLVVGVMKGSLGGREKLSFPIAQEAISQTGAFPSAVAIHGIVASYDRSYTGMRQGAQRGFCRRKVGFCALRSGIPAICESMEIYRVGDFRLP